MLEPLRQGPPPLDPAAVSNAASCALPARYEAVGEARRFTRGALEHWETGDRFDDICLVVSELVTNALRHGLPLDHRQSGHEAHRSPSYDATGTARNRAEDPPVRLHLMRCAGRVVCAVRDPSHDTPVAGDTDDCAAESGRGLFLVESFSDSWGWHPLDGAVGGKVVWALFRLENTG
ncbi:ATP-binding protein [Streptomyces sp. NPDC046831]|uniref:ATP-binding protein n=1 Tax=Streptomyces sp. NPDC046831 TaxID=3154805 RepID=UPI0033C453E7